MHAYMYYLVDTACIGACFMSQQHLAAQLKAHSDAPPSPDAHQLSIATCQPAAGREGIIGPADSDVEDGPLGIFLTVPVTKNRPAGRT